jgi:hypothetical protein
MGNYWGFVKTLVHEMIHMQAFQSWQMPLTGKAKQRRQGLNIYHSDTIGSFEWLDEAITEALTKRFLEAHQKDIEILNGIRKPAVRVEDARRKKNSKDGHTYVKQREALSKLVATIYIRGGKKYRTQDDVLKLFTGAALNGRLLPVARAIEKAEGRGMFKELAKLDINMKEKAPEV